MRKSVIALACLIAVAGLLAVRAQETPPTKKADPQRDVAVVMKEKLRYSHQLLTSLAREDYAQLEVSAQELARIAREEWAGNPTEEYRTQLQVFWTTLEGIESGAQRKEIDEATLAYMQMTLSCVKCHKLIRREQQQQ
jgi:cytochrome c556